MSFLMSNIFYINYCRTYPVLKEGEFQLLQYIGDFARPYEVIFYLSLFDLFCLLDHPFIVSQPHELILHLVLSS